MSHLKDLIHEIHRRSLWQVVGTYLLGGWIAPFYLQYDPVFDVVRGDSRFHDILGGMRADVERMRLEIEREETAAGER